MTIAPEQATVVVGVEGVVGSRAAIRLAAREAAYRQAPLVAAQATLHDAVVDALGERAPGVELRTVAGQAGRSLVDVARRANAQLIVLASRTGAATLLGTVSQYVLRKAPCPVLVVPDAAGGEG